MVADSKNHRVQVYDSTSGLLVRQLGAQGAGPGQFQEPCGVTVDLEGRIVVADRGNHRLQVLDEQGGFIRSIGTQGSEPGQFSDLRAVAVDAQGHIYATDYSQHRVHVFDSQGDLVHSFGDRHLERPWGIAVLDDTGHVLVASYGTHEVKVFNKADGSLAGILSQWCTPRPSFVRAVCVAVNAKGRKVYVSYHCSLHHPTTTLRIVQQPKRGCINARGMGWACSHRIGRFISPLFVFGLFVFERTREQDEECTRGE